MIYKRLDVLPYKVLIEIMTTGDFNLLCTDETPPENLDLKTLWKELEDEYIRINPSKDEDKVVKYTREVYYFELKYKQVITFCKVLEFDYDEEIINKLIQYGYSLNHDNYLDRLETVRREANALLDKALKFKSMIPKPEERAGKSTVDDMFASYSAILSIDFDYNTVSVTKVIALGKQIDLKIKALESSNTPKK